MNGTSNSGNITQHIILRLRQTPPLPTASSRLLQMLQNKNSDTTEASELIQKDPAITARILSLVNSSVIGFQRDITSVKEALMYLGFGRVARLVLAAGAMVALKPDKKKASLDWKSFWLHSAGTGMLAAAMAKTASCPHPADEIFTAGLLHDLGRLTLDYLEPELYARVLETAYTEKITTIDAERKILGIDHSRIGEFAARKWQLPMLIIATIKHHHEDFSERAGTLASGDRIIDLVQIADWAMITRNLAFSATPFVDMPSNESFERIGKTPDEVLDETDQVKDDLQRTSRSFGLESN